MEVDSEIGPLAFTRFGHIVDGADMERNKLFLVDRDQQGEVLLIDEELTWLQLWREVLQGLVRLNLIQVLLLLLFCSKLDVIGVESFLEFLKLLVE